MNKDKIIDAIAGMRERDALTAIIDAAEARDSHLSRLESDERRKRSWAKFSHLRAGDTVFIHKAPLKDTRYVWMWGKPLTIKAIMPRKKELVIRGDQRGKGIALTALVADSFGLSEVPTSEALEHVLKGESE